jgi:1-acyl-sn-glycerol-3-phosphate acyltransferase
MPGQDGGAGFLRRCIYRLHFVAASLFGGALFVTLSTLALFRLVVLKWERDRAARRWLDRWSRTMNAVLGWTVEVENRDRLTESRPAVIVGNHQSNVDAVVWAAFFPDATVAIGKKQIAMIPVFGWLFKATGNILVDRDNTDKAHASIEEAVARIRRESLLVWMAPEGHRNQGPEMLPFKKGAFHLAIAAQVPIVPFVDGPFAPLLNAGRLMVRPGRIAVRVLEPVPTRGLAQEDVEALSARVRCAMDTVRKELIAAAGPPIG